MFFSNRPYPEDAILSIIPHVAPTWSQAYAYQVEQEANTDYSGDIEDAVFDRPAVQPTQPPKSSLRGLQKQLKVVQVLAGGSYHGAQVLKCVEHDEGKSGLPTSNNINTYVAKVFDPLYSPNSIPEVNYEYSMEADAYKRIEANKSTQPGFCTPKFFGTWCLEVHEKLRKPSSGQMVKPPRTRIVCLILMEYIEGNTLYDLAHLTRGRVEEGAFKAYSESVRLHVWARMLEAEAWLQHIGISQCDMSTVNTMVSPLPRPQEKAYPRVVIIDFNTASIEPIDTGANPGGHQRLPESPIVRCDWQSWPSTVREWCPKWWWEDEGKRHAWLMKEFGEGAAAEARYQKLSK